MHALLIAAILAAPGDRIFIRRGGEFALTASERTGLGTCITNVVPGASPSTLQSLEAFKRGAAAGDIARIRGVDRRTVTAATFLAREDAGLVAGVVSIDVSGNVTYDHKVPGPPVDWARLSTGEWTCFANWAAAATGQTAASIRRVEARRDNGAVLARINHEERAAPATYVRIPRDEVAQAVGVE